MLNGTFSSLLVRFIAALFLGAIIIKSPGVVVSPNIVSSLSKNMVIILVEEISGKCLIVNFVKLSS